MRTTNLKLCAYNAQYWCSPRQVRCPRTTRRKSQPLRALKNRKCQYLIWTDCTISLRRSYTGTTSAPWATRSNCSSDMISSDAIVAIKIWVLHIKFYVRLNNGMCFHFNLKSVNWHENEIHFIYIKNMEMRMQNWLKINYISTLG